MLEAVLFDMDGVIIDSEPLHIRVVMDILKNRGVDISFDHLKRFIGVSNTEMWTALIAEFRLDATAAGLSRAQHEMNIRALDEHDDLMIPGTGELLRDIRKHRLKTAIASSSNPEYIRAVIDKLYIAGFFDTVVSGEQVPRGKPMPDIFVKTAELLDVQPGDCVVIEDSDHGVRAAVAAGMKVIGFRNPHSGSQLLAQAHYTVDSISDISMGLLRSVHGARP